MNNQSGVYEIFNTVNGKRYIGSSNDCPGRWRTHLHMLRSARHANHRLQKDWSDHGEGSFIFRIILPCPKEQLLFQEQRCIHGFLPDYNIYLSSSSPKGVIRSAEYRSMMADAMRGNQNGLGYRHSDEARKKISSALLGKSFSPEHLANHSAAKIGRKRGRYSDKARINMSIVKIGNKNCLGYKHTPEARANMAAARLGKKRGPYKTSKSPSEYERNFERAAKRKGK